MAHQNIEEMIDNFREEFDDMFVDDIKDKLSFEDKTKISILQIRSKLSEFNTMIKKMEKVFNLAFTDSGTKQ